MVSKKILSIFILGTALVTCGNSSAQASSMTYGSPESTDQDVNIEDLWEGFNSLLIWLNGSGIQTTESFTVTNTTEPFTIVSNGNNIEDIFGENSNPPFIGTLIVQGGGQDFDGLESDETVASYNNIVINNFNFNVYPNSNPETEPDTVMVSNTDSNVEEPVPAESVPEPLTLLGAGVAVGFGSLFKRELNKKKKKYA